LPYEAKHSWWVHRFHRHQVIEHSKHGDRNLA
jgi:hypothetical protein